MPQSVIPHQLGQNSMVVGLYGKGELFTSWVNGKHMERRMLDFLSLYILVLPQLPSPEMMQ